LVAIFVNSDDGGDMLLRNVGCLSKELHDVVVLITTGVRTSIPEEIY
jgi:hypothetical protein